MLNLLISYNPESWDSSPYLIDTGRFAEYTEPEISERYRSLEAGVLEELKSFPTLFVTEGESTESRIGLISNIRIRNRSLVIDFEIDESIPPLPIGSIEGLRIDLGLGNWELSRTHWSIKDEDLLEILIKHGLLNAGQAAASRVFGKLFEPIPQQLPNEANNNQVFIVHGHDELTKLDMAKFISSLGLEPIILHMQASSGMTIIEKIEAYSNVGFAVVLYTPCDAGAKYGDINYKARARQNVVFEHGYLIAKLGRPKVAAFVKGDVETPNDISGVIYIPFDEQETWKASLINELRAAGYAVN